MKLPTKIRVGRRWYSVEVIEAMIDKTYVGRVHYDAQHIRIGTRDHSGKPFTKHEVGDTFWHELTHAILHDMDSPLYRDERFVSAFATRLNKAINTAKFE